MKKIKTHLKLILYVLLFFSISNVVYSKKLNKHYDSNKIFNYFAGVSSLYDNEYASSYKYLKKIEGLENEHYTYSQFYQYSLINSERINEAYRYSKKLEKKGIEGFESKLIAGVYHLKNKRNDEALKYFQKLKINNGQEETISGLVAKSLENWIIFSKSKKDHALQLVEKMPPRFKSIKKIQSTFVHCFFESSSTEQNFEKLLFDQKTDFSRYSFFYANYLNKKGKIREAIDIIDRSLDSSPRNLILNQFKTELENKKTVNFNNEFNCKNLSHISAEILYIVANILSSQSSYVLSNFYLSLAKYLNPNFISFETLYAENFYMMNRFEKAKNIYKDIIKSGSDYSWHASKEISNILREQEKEIESVEFLKNSYKKINLPNVNEIYDYARFLKNNEEFYESIKYYTKVLNLIDKKHFLYPRATDGRGIAYERTDQWKKAENDFLNSLSVSPDQAHVINYLAYSWIEKGINVEQSLKMLEKANELKKNDGYIVDSLGWALFKLERYEEAEEYLRLALILMPADPIVNDHYGDVLWMKNEKIKARYYWNYAFNSEEAEKDLVEIIRKKKIFGLDQNLKINKL